MKRQIQRSNATRRQAVDYAAERWRLEMREQFLPILDRLGEALYKIPVSGKADMDKLAPAQKEWADLDDLVWGLRTAPEQRAIMLIRKDRGQPIPKGGANSAKLETHST